MSISIKSVSYTHLDVYKRQVEEFIYPEKAEIIGYKPRTKGHSMQIKKAAKLLESAKRPVICCGGGVVSAGARDCLLYTSTGKGN